MAKVIKMNNKGERFVTTVSEQLAQKLGMIGAVLVLPNFLKAVVRIHCGGGVTPPIKFYYCGHPDARLRAKFNIKQKKVDAYG